MTPGLRRHWLGRNPRAERFPVHSYSTTTIRIHRQKGIHNYQLLYQFLKSIQLFIFDKSA
ncbi:uncharacterized protein RSE6_14408 [Rhynchosporium secalis]|uniref:Uncharacterized protein n=1 Tax=Rhynchosporium secalis TaxID=38038 RepID=A0A1E1MV84_RHYSE|nr:uncharacterized protein RSE6_14408 [Rhynchosporium secalis]